MFIQAGHLYKGECDSEIKFDFKTSAGVARFD